MSKQPTLLKDILLRFVESNGWKDLYLQSQLESFWGEIYSERFPQIAKISTVKDSFLYIKCESSTWKYELKQRKFQIKSQINEKFGFNAIKDIFFQ